MNSPDASRCTGVEDQGRAQQAPTTAPAVLSKTSSAETTRPVNATYCTVSIMHATTAATTATRRGSRNGDHRIGATKPSVNSRNRFPSS